jgi:outer membrane protein OmpA-like peptidoglycan-associated protein
MKKTYLILISLLLIAPSQYIIAQQSQEEEPIMYLGGYANFNYNMHLANFTQLPGYPSCCPEYRTGNGYGFSLGGLLEIPLKPSLNLGGRLGISMLNGTMTENDNIGNTLVRIVNSQSEPEIRNVMVDHIIDASVLAIDFEPYINFIFFDKLYSTAGIRLSYLLSPTFDTREEITDPNNVVFLDGRALRNDFDAQDIPDLNAFQIGASIGLGYELEIGKDSYLSPEIRYYLPFMNISSVDWKIAAFQVGASIKFPIYPEKDIPVIKDTVYQRDTVMIADYGFTEERIVLKDTREDVIVEELSNNILERTVIIENYEKQVPKEAKFFTAIETYGINKDGEKQQNPTIVIEEIETEEMFPILPYIFFPENSSDITKTDMRLLPEQETAAFDEQNLPWNAMSIYSNMLNIVAKRMLEKPNSKIIITGTNKNMGAELNNLTLSQNRADQVKSYFTDVWNIDPSRIETRKRNLPASPGNNEHPDGQLENQRAEITSNDNDILMPLTLKEIARTSNPPVVEIVPKSESEVGIESWQVSVDQKGRNIRRFEGQDVPEKIKWSVEEDPMPRLEEPINVEFSARDILGQKSSAKSDISLQQLTIKKKREIIKDDKRIEKFSLILFDYDKANLTQIQANTLSQIKSRIQPNTQVTITGYADRTGEQAYNKELSNRRIQEVQRVLQVPEGNLIMKPVGSSVLLYDNDSPQGRSYSRTVQITLETPVENK